MMDDRQKKLQFYPPLPWGTFRGFLIFFHVFFLLVMGMEFVMAVWRAWGEPNWQNILVCLALLGQAVAYILLVMRYRPNRDFRLLLPGYFGLALALWVVELLLAPRLFWLGFVFVGQMFGILSPLPALAGGLFVLSLIAWKGPISALQGGTTLEQIGWVASNFSLLVLLLYVSHLNRTSRERAHLIEQLKKTQKELEEARQKESELAVLRERERLARDMHDTLGHNLVALSVQLEAVQRLYPVDPQAASEAINDLKRLTRGSMDELRRTLAGLRAPGLGERPLKEALQELCADFSRRNGLPVRFDWEAGEVQLPPPVAEALWRSAQEALTNIEKHAAGAGEAAVCFQAFEGGFRLVVEDDGPGFDYRPAAGRHFGLAGMRERVEGVGGRLAIGNVPGKGTRLEVHIPLVEGTA